MVKLSLFWFVYSNISLIYYKVPLVNPNRALIFTKEF